jgi:phosphatidylinositol alpha-mannosyltransferase
MAAGRPVVATDIPGYREVVHHERDGLLVPPNDPAALAEALSRLLANPGLARALGERGRADAARYRWETIAGEVETAYGDALAAGGRRETPR